MFVNGVRNYADPFTKNVDQVNMKRNFDYMDELKEFSDVWWHNQKKGACWNIQWMSILYEVHTIILTKTNPFLYVCIIYIDNVVS